MINDTQMISFGISLVSPWRTIGVYPTNPTYISAPSFLVLRPDSPHAYHNPLRLSPQPSRTDWHRGHSIFYLLAFIPKPFTSLCSVSLAILLCVGAFPSHF